MRAPRNRRQMPSVCQQVVGLPSSGSAASPALAFTPHVVRRHAERRPQCGCISTKSCVRVRPSRIVAPRAAQGCKLGAFDVDLDDGGASRARRRTVERYGLLRVADLADPDRLARGTSG